MLRTPGAILCYHSITFPQLDGEGVNKVSLATLDMSLEVASSLGEFVSVDEFLARLRDGRSCRGLFAVTFDDAYAAILPAFEQSRRLRDVPFTVFVVPGASTHGSKFWWDRIEDMLPFMNAAQRVRLATVLGSPDTTDTVALFQLFREAVLNECDGQLPKHLDGELARIEAECARGTLHRAMTVDELQSLCRHSTVSLGVHTMTHRVLPSLPTVEIEREVSGSLQWLRERFTQVSPSIAFPFGLFDARSTAAALQCGLSGVLTLEGCTIRRRISSTVVPRMSVSRGENAVKLWLKLNGSVELVRDALRPSWKAPVLPPRATTFAVDLPPQV